MIRGLHLLEASLTVLKRPWRRRVKAAKVAMAHMAIKSMMVRYKVVGELEVFVRGATSMYANIKPEDCQFTVIELSPEILPILPKQLIRWSKKD